MKTNSMHPEIGKKISELNEALIEYAPYEAVSFHLFVNCEEVEASIKTRTPEQLKKAGISMRNLAGDFIRGNPVTS
ncbi:hypothetical protein UFOVP1007_50 [uncultured Caudovirales phage]|uniref:Uncharacterized protein n=1 Tax=uncultured Caudovirales phage TaxID=2100421 RepID=A0A6J5QSS4_9CAUD|nr:hypothetical protein UFOVP927_13 [uncultured Caudovirales phage]CAB4178288.1 hypothetical protein UFOVP1007_50 [uncultured Caudovirales phage]CAB4187623.1 hypothetical protein UFOVP1159_50 [uncultured Caudovirales phage]